ncbi:FhaA domain-containing protein [Dictyobacter formicarum]|uniref:FHA domain-containing protein n=1 Tax=Dictyobacter formicarum TaxID=2778368 RepID=A0ABQ3VBA8_9CHLR|nr:DUF3662 and FHA domain-containing protein [Dictyobacter formicarum]GHO83049.1 hypothetical protein KSZ_10550 [Dictyobacter formicarum]
MNARQNPLAKLEAFMQRVIETPFNRLFPSKMEPIEIARKLERAMDDNTMLQGEGRRLSPNVYDIYLSIKDHQQLSPGQTGLIRDWQNHLVEFAKRRHYTLKTVPIIRLHSDTSLRPGMVRIDTEQADQGGGLMATQALSAEQLANIRAQLATNQPLPGIDGGSSPNQGMHGRGSHSGAGHQGYAHHSNPGVAPTIPPTPQTPMPQAWLTIRLPQAGQQTYRIEKPLVNIGRQLSNDIIVEDKRVSRYHAQIKYQPDGQFAIFDLGSTNGITINNTPHMRQHILRNGDQFTIGSYDFYFERR